jgi:hypothetical protein
MNKSTRFILVIILVLTTVAAIAIFLNRDQVNRNKELTEEALFVVMENGEEIITFDLSDLQEIGQTDFVATVNSSSSDPQTYTYTGVLMKDIYHYAGIDLADREALVVTAADGYVVAVDMNKFLDDDNVYLAYRQDGEWLKSREEGGSGPYMMIIRKDPFSQFWCKYAVSSDLR